MRHCLIISALLSLPVLAADAIERDQPAIETLYVRRIAPLLREKCLGCHGDDPDTIEGGLDLRTAAAMLSGGDSEASPIRVDEPNQSPLLLAVQRQSSEWSSMPPKEAEQLTPQQIEWIRQWVAGGATWPSPKRQAEIEAENGAAWSTEDGIRMATSGGLDEEWTNRRYKPESLWAYQSVEKPAVPEDANAIDWLLDQVTPSGLVKSKRADRSTLLRRATFDLTGLPPTPDEIVEFTSDSRAEKVAFAAVVERLLASPHYGERMAQHWLDVARYADSSGLANDYERGNAWRFRDYVIRSFNNDKPYDQFIREQIAGDELAPNNPESMIATGFLRMGPWELTGMRSPKLRGNDSWTM